ncbi:MULTISPECIES: hypothetical protein [Afipia]|uniref:Uncharacterized protein n=1 Tax=Afipia massiliensis TaxID=211460 RepID=A0A840N586_9BRAD|nr:MULTISPECIES: hypothetical protein [Afipia]MBB5051886.1 hypothetical protein [Afipia massiliensis]
MHDGHWAERRRPPAATVTVEELEGYLDRLAQIIVQAGKKGAVYLPLYERLESELEKAKAMDARLARVQERIK